MRRQPVAFCLIDAAFLSDPKFRALNRRLADFDDFNSAVGAYFVALAAARRNGDPHLDAFEETGSRFIVDLEAVGLLNGQGFNVESFESWAPKAPVQQAGGRSRAESAERDGKGHFLPSTIQHLPSTIQHLPSTPQQSSLLASLDKLDQLSPPINSSLRRGGVGGNVAYCKHPEDHREAWTEPAKGVGLQCLECTERGPLPFAFGMPTS